MALIKCPECNKEISDKAVNCPNCGYPICTESNKVVPSESETENVIIRGRDKIIETDGENVLISQKEKVLYNGPIYKLEVQNNLEPSFINNGYFQLLPQGKIFPIHFYAKEKEDYYLLSQLLCTLKCPKCGSDDISVNLAETGIFTKGKSESRKKSVVTRAANDVGRAGMIAMTGGLWALTPKKSKYIDKSKNKSTVENTKTCICQSCGHSWKIK